MQDYQLIFVDGNNRAHQISHAVRRDTPDSQVPEKASQAFRDLLLALYGRYPAAGLVVCWDHPDAVRVRRAELADYKQHREHDPLISQSVQACHCLLYTSPSPRD